MSLSVKVSKSMLELVQGDITLEDTDAIVNAANKQLSPGGGVSGAIHRAAGNSLWQEAKTLGGCRTGEAKITKGYDLAADYVIHTVGPVYSGSDKDPEDLRDCYENSLKLAGDEGLSSISFPSISTGIFGYPVKQASMIALGTIMDHLKQDSRIEIVRMVLFSDSDYSTYERTLKELQRR